MKYYSEKLRKIFESVEDLKAAEKEFDKQEKELQLKKEAKIARVKEIEAKEEEIKKLRAERDELINKFLKDYPEGFHTTIKHPITTSRSLIDWMMDNWF